MTIIVQHFKDNMPSGCQVQGNLHGENCVVLMEDAEFSHVSISCDKHPSAKDNNLRRGDFLVAVDLNGAKGLIIPLELKSGDLKVGHAARQLQATADLARKHIPNVNNIILMPIAASGSMNNAHHKKIELRRIRIKLANHKEPIRQIKCGANLARIIKSFKKRIKGKR